MKTKEVILSDLYIKLHSHMDFGSTLDAMQEYAEEYHADQIQKIMEEEGRKFDENQ